ncbi:hypothetical protein BKE38_27415 [Pseudoroseomonas deserti]|uniref:Uncharacterized protein n=1 Tax=Teichococcus deserti TaxID=1817963 RepID=A0A1V2GVG5_9PROT|nr:hypothetical protein [Pseudoroseomonas deserti]ONG44743.1 hypothetical protein BKE38_27415 [Pseudoroseomonas deserti]
MPFDARGLTALANTDSFTLWLYITTDTRAAVLAPGYFTAAISRLKPGHVILLEAADAIVLMPVLANGNVGNGLVLSATAAPIRINAEAALLFEMTMDAVTAATRSVALDPLPSGLYVSRVFTVAARVSGPVTSVIFSMLNSSGAVIAGPTTVAVSAGSATIDFTAPSPGSGYRIRVTDAGEPLATQTSASFVVTEPFALLTESGMSLTGIEGGELLL